MGDKTMKYNMKAMVSSLALVMLVAGCAPAPTTDTQADGSTTGANYGGANTGGYNYYNTNNTAATQPAANPAANNGGYYNQPPAADNTNAGGYDSQATYDYSAPGGSGAGSDYSSYNGSYGANNYASNSYSGNSYSSGYSSGSGNYGSSYSGGSNYSSSYSSGSRNGSYAVQVVASSSRSTADSMQRQMQSMGYAAVVDQVGGLYKVRVPYTSESEAKSSLNRIRSTIPDAFFTTR